MIFLLFAMKWMELECIMLSEISQSEKAKYHMISLIWNLRKQVDERMGVGVKKEGNKP